MKENKILADTKECSVTSETGMNWCVNKDGLWRCEPKMWNLPTSSWRQWDSRFERISLFQRRGMSVLCVPVDALEWKGEKYLAYDCTQSTSTVSFDWNKFAEWNEKYAEGFQLLSLLMEDIQRMDLYGVKLISLDVQQCMNIPEPKLMLCGENLTGPIPAAAARFMDCLLGRGIDKEWMASWMKEALIRNKKQPMSAREWGEKMKKGAKRSYICPICGKEVMAGNVCSCGYAQVHFMLHRSKEMEWEEVIIPINKKMELSELYPDQTQTPTQLLKIVYQAESGEYLLHNISDKAMFYAIRNQREKLKPGKSVKLEAGLKVVVMPTQLELEYIPI